MIVIITGAKYLNRFFVFFVVFTCLLPDNMSAFSVLITIEKNYQSDDYPGGYIVDVTFREIFGERRKFNNGTLCKLNPITTVDLMEFAEDVMHLEMVPEMPLTFYGDDKIVAWFK